MLSLEQIYNFISPYTVVSLNRWNKIAECLKEVQNLDGDIAEFGVYKGGIAKGMRILEPQKTMHLIDSFSGMQEPTTYEPFHKAGDFADTSLDAVMALIGNDPEVFYYPGWFPSSVTSNLEESKFSLVHLDVDYGDSYQSGIEFFYPRLVSGGIMLFDEWDYVNCPSAKESIKNCAAKYNFEVISTVESQGMLRKV